MANYSGFSQALNTSGLSNVSRSTSIRGPNRVDLSTECSSQTNLTGRVAKGPSIGAKGGSGRLEEVNGAFSRCQDTMSDYVIKKLIKECLEEISQNGGDKIISKNTAKKLRKFLAIHEMEKHLHLPNNGYEVGEKLSLLGITDLPKIILSKEEKVEVKRSLEHKLREKTNSFLVCYEKMGGNVKDLTKRSESAGRHEISEVIDNTDLYQWKEKIDQECLDYEKHLLEHKNNLSDWMSLKSENMNNMELKKAERLLIKVQVSEVQAKITKLNCILKMFKETPHTLDAYRTLNSDLDDKIAAVEDEIQKKETLKKSYEALRGTEYDEIVQKYSDLCKAIEKKKRLIEKFGS